MTGRVRCVICMLYMCCRECIEGGQVTITTQHHTIESFPCPPHVLAPILRNRQLAQFMCWQLQFLPVMRQPTLNVAIAMYNGLGLPWRRHWHVDVRAATMTAFFS